MYKGQAGSQTATFVLTRAGDTAATINVRAATANGTATAGSDYTAMSATIVAFAAGETTKTLTVNLNGDTTVEPDETILLNLTALVGAAISDSSGTATIANDGSVKRRCGKGVARVRGSRTSAPPPAGPRRR